MYRCSSLLAMAARGQRSQTPRDAIQHSTAQHGFRSTRRHAAARGRQQSPAAARVPGRRAGAGPHSGCPPLPARKERREARRHHGQRRALRVRCRLAKQRPQSRPELCSHCNYVTAPTTAHYSTNLHACVQAAKRRHNATELGCSQGLPQPPIIKGAPRVEVGAQGACNVGGIFQRQIGRKLLRTLRREIEIGAMEGGRSGTMREGQTWVQAA